MAEAVGVTAAIIEITKFAWSTRNKIKALRQAPKELVTLQSELELLEALAKRVNVFADRNLTFETELAAFILPLVRHLKSIDDFITNLCQDTRLWRAKWVMQQEDAAKLLHTLQASLAPLNTMLNILSV